MFKVLVQERGWVSPATSLRSASAYPREVSTVHTPLLHRWDQVTPHGIQPMNQVPTQHLPYLVSVHRIFLLQLTLSHCLVLSLIFLQFFCWHLWNTFGKHAFKDERNTGKAVWKLSVQTGRPGRAGKQLLNKAAPIAPPSLLSKPCQTLTNTVHDDRNLSVPTAVHYPNI